MADGELETLLLQIARARSDGTSFHETMQMAVDFLAARPASYANGRRDDFLKRATDSMTRFGGLNDADCRAGSAERTQAMRFLTDLLSDLDVAVPKVSAAAKAVQLKETIERGRIKMGNRRAAHRKERLARGLSEQAGSAHPDPRIPIYTLPVPELDLSIRQSQLLRGVHAAAVESARKRGGRGLGKSVSIIDVAIALRDQQVLAALPLGASRIGGLPDLPPDHQWPQINGRKLPFVAQINVAHFPAAHHLLPSDAHLLFFVLASNDEGFWPPVARVLFYRGPAESLTRSPFPEPDEIWPDWGDERVYEISAATATPPQNNPADKRSKQNARAGWLFGEFDFDETPGEVADRHFEDGDDWTTLLAVESNGSMLWSDAGELYLIARRSAIARQDFSNVLAEVCSS